MDKADKLLVALGAALRDIRLQRHLSQEQVGLSSGVHRNYLGGIERGERSPSVATIIRLSGVLDVQVSELFEMAEQISARQPSG